MPLSYLPFPLVAFRKAKQRWLENYDCGCHGRTFGYAFLDFDMCNCTPDPSSFHFDDTEVDQKELLRGVSKLIEKAQELVRIKQYKHVIFLMEYMTRWIAQQQHRPVSVFKLLCESWKSILPLLPLNAVETLLILARMVRMYIYVCTYVCVCVSVYGTQEFHDPRRRTC